MSDYTRITINIALEAANDPFYEPPSPTNPALELVFCEQWENCTDPRCYEYGCLNALRKQGKEACS
ncbi:MAG: hypothetical protein KZQ86_00500 [Candidatus Thiodiazotropha sp. (ex Lucinoma kastoroae)]|nr:hypothetical protein [Candidatus Thiodiazotropha sp. (ex Lucinoma kastoroae)]